MQFSKARANVIHAIGTNKITLYGLDQMPQESDLEGKGAGVWGTVEWTSIL